MKPAMGENSEFNGREKPLLSGQEKELIPLTKEFTDLCNTMYHDGVI